MFAVVTRQRLKELSLKVAKYEDAIREIRELKLENGALRRELARLRASASETHR